MELNIIIGKELAALSRVKCGRKKSSGERPAFSLTSLAYYPVSYFEKL